MNKENLQAIIIRLNEIKKGVSVNKNEGICFNLYLYTDNNCSITPTGINNNEWLKDQFIQWPECHVYEDGSKCIHYPVGGPLEFNFSKSTNPKRHRLLDFLIEQAKQQLSETDKEQ